MGRVPTRPAGTGYCDAYICKLVEIAARYACFVAYPAVYDFMFVYWDLIRFAGESPFSFPALDIKSYAMAVLVTEYRHAIKRACRSTGLIRCRIPIGHSTTRLGKAHCFVTCSRQGVPTPDVSNLYMGNVEQLGDDLRPKIGGVVASKIQGAISVRPTRKPRLSIRCPVVLESRNAERRLSGGKFQEAPRSIRYVQSPPSIQAEPSVGAPS
jgi:hypothetical protein